MNSDGENLFFHQAVLLGNYLRAKSRVSCYSRSDVLRLLPEPRFPVRVLLLAEQAEVQQDEWTANAENSDFNAGVECASMKT